MSRRRVFASVAGAALAGSACMAYPSNPWFEQAQSPAPVAAPVSSATDFTPAVAQAGGDREEGPRVSIYAELANSNGTRLVRGNFHLDDDAYVLVGHIDLDGILRIEFPDTPLDNGFAKGHASYQTAQFFAGFTDQYRARFSTNPVRPTAAAASDSYDGGGGYVFIIASWQPLHFEKFSSGGLWDSFEVADADYARDPRPAVYELAASLAGTNPSSYTVKFAQAFSTLSPYMASNAWNDAYYDAANSFGAQMCSGLGYGYSFGFASSPFSSALFSPISAYGYGQSFWWRGAYYRYSAAGDCYYNNSSLPYNGVPYIYGWTVAQTPVVPPGTGRFFGTDKIHSPVTPQGAPLHLAPGGATDVGGGSTNASRLTLAPEPTSPEYRNRGLVAHEDPAGSGDFIAPRNYGGNRAHDAGSQSTNAQGMVIRNGNSGRAQAGNYGNNSAGNNSAGNNAPRPQVQSHTDAPRAAPQNRSDGPRAEAPRMAPAPSAPHVEAPRSPSPPPASTSSSSSGSGGKPPSGKN